MTHIHWIQQLTVHLCCCLLSLFFVSPAKAGFLFSNFTNTNADFLSTLAGFDSTGGYSVGFTLNANVQRYSSRPSRCIWQLALARTLARWQHCSFAMTPVGGNASFSFNPVVLTTNFVLNQPLQAVVFTPVNPVTLTANNTYWLTLGTTLDSNNQLVVGQRNVAPTGTDAVFAAIDSVFMRRSSILCPRISHQPFV